MTSPIDQTLYRTRPFTKFWEVFIDHLQRVWHADRGRLLLRTPGPVPFKICKCSFVETTDTKSYISLPIHGSLSDLTSYRIWLISWIWHHHFMSLSLVWLLTEFDMTEYRFPWGICNGCGMLTGDAYSWSRPFGTCICSTCTEFDSFPGFDTTISCPFPWFDFLLNLTWLNIGFHGASATGVAC